MGLVLVAVFVPVAFIPGMTGMLYNLPLISKWRFTYRDDIRST